ncbi:HlyD family type I secretion periplasmic adaptor subunit [Tabrizicola piscis]|uniref:Membrane fusion protein (MFP) family protein n=1 Tax=Tabrizicola piscis TaxID=2494374 RepID=A0A3S8UAW8_9RHOB|nr:HlyD family type I secretion periplasmic adaptor subunit [Tabrizicola piscis]AZL60756.1 HlyD family type I secretion periplasmic adaptor subunit [Tabrizicola piscis]
MSAPYAQWSATRPLFWGFLTLTLLVAGLGVWSIFTTLAGAIIAPGRIEVSLNRQVVQHPDGGVVEEILVQDGADVSAGDVLLRLDGSALRSELAIVENQLLELGARRARLEAQRDESDTVVFPEILLAAATGRPYAAEILAGQASLFTKQAEALIQAREQRQTRIEQIESQMTGLAAQQEAIATQTRLLEADLVTQQDLLAKGLTQATRVSGLERELAQLKGRMGELISAQAEAAGRITEIDIEITALTTQQREKAEAELRDVAARQLELQEREGALAERIARLDVRAPSSGLVLGLTVTTPRSVIRPADDLMFIVPQDRPLLVAARVPVTHVDEVRPGQDVRLVFSSLPSRTTPEVTGKITLVSADALSDERTGITYFRVEIALDAAALQQLGEVDIIPGMPVDAFILTTDRTPLSYLLKPFTDYFRSAFRET